ncbi:hypothetical protein ID866_7932 [Astraeus odoratus]|nr:hypothetical protein ID866_7932 [Astraeus odoratus]
MSDVEMLDPVSTAGTGAKPKSAKPSRPRSRSPTPPPPPQRPPQLQTIRLDIKLGGPDKYEVDIATLSKATGQRQPTPPPPKQDSSDTDGDETDRAKPKRKKKHFASEYYDVNDPFIDDSELNIDNRTHFAQTKQQGFYVSSGEVALMRDVSPKKPKSKKPPPPDAGPSKHEDGTSDFPISLLMDDKANKKPKNYVTIEEKFGRKRKIIEISEFHPDLQGPLEALKDAIPKQDWSNKQKFPASLKPLLADVSLKAIHLGEYDDDFFNLMPLIFPYNRFTMMVKLIKRTVFQDHYNILTARQDELLEHLERLTKEGFPKAQEEWEKSVAAWHRRHEKTKSSEADPGGPSTPSAAETAQPDDSGALSSGEGNDPDNPSAAGKHENTRDAHPPAKKYRLTEQMRSIIWQLVMLSNECCRLENEKHDLESTGQQVSEQGSRKALYQRIVAAFPKGWLNSGQISREVSAMKKRLERDTAATTDGYTEA